MDERHHSEDDRSQAVSGLMDERGTILPPLGIPPNADVEGLGIGRSGAKPVGIPLAEKRKRAFFVDLDGLSSEESSESEESIGVRARLVSRAKPILKKAVPAEKQTAPMPSATGNLERPSVPPLKEEPASPKAASAPPPEVEETMQSFVKNRRELAAGVQRYVPYHKEAEKSEKTRLEEGKKSGKGCNFRPDTVAFSAMKAAGLVSPKADQIGDEHLGLCIGDQFEYRAQMTTTAVHKQLVRGICVVEVNRKEYASSVVMSGQKDDKKLADNQVLYLGEGTEPDQQHKMRGNMALMRNLEDCVPVRLFEKKKHKNWKTSRFVYEGLFVVVRHERTGKGELAFVLQFLRGRASNKPLPWVKERLNASSPAVKEEHDVHDGTMDGKVGSEPLGRRLAKVATTLPALVEEEVITLICEDTPTADRKHYVESIAAMRPSRDGDLRQSMYRRVKTVLKSQYDSNARGYWKHGSFMAANAIGAVSTQKQKVKATGSDGPVKQQVKDEFSSPSYEPFGKCGACDLFGHTVEQCQVKAIRK